MQTTRDYYLKNIDTLGIPGASGERKSVLWSWLGGKDSWTVCKVSF